MNTIEGNYCAKPIDVTPYVKTIGRHNAAKFFTNRIRFVCTQCDGANVLCHSQSPDKWYGTHFLCEALAVMRPKRQPVPREARKLATIHQLASAAARFPLYFGPVAAEEWASRCKARSAPPVMHVDDALSLIVAGIASQPVVVYAYPPQKSLHARAVRQWNQWLIAHALHPAWAWLLALAVERATGLPTELAWHIVRFVTQRQGAESETGRTGAVRRPNRRLRTTEARRG